ncbi:hypothetical protein KSF_111880 [Reticulibacter mediterranei]|uniref:VOC domain-containing protein n=1 Tax=Reticulibacter mediterranei TaxID=2778369 RepID=A0A8J3NA01_9CHLR|nr:VOC family protein [Reticulibacter mediterranei]GHP01141.1 hypothetical protein KSF_111880 [Reticulibacter mediterranei]
MKFHAIRLLVKNFHESLAFYRDVLGFSGWQNDDLEYAYFEEQQLALFARGRMVNLIGEGDPTSSSQCVLQFEVDEVDDAFDRLQKKGIHFITRPTDMTEWGSRVAHFRDPDGNVIELYQSIRK